MDKMYEPSASSSGGNIQQQTKSTEYSSSMQAMNKGDLPVADCRITGTLMDSINARLVAAARAVLHPLFKLSPVELDWTVVVCISCFVAAQQGPARRPPRVPLDLSAARAWNDYALAGVMGWRVCDLDDTLRLRLFYLLVARPMLS